MGGYSKIEWTEATWNPVTGCSKLSTGCKNCYAERIARRLRIARVPRYRNGFELTLHQDVLNVPIQWRKPRIVFVNSMSDLFHMDVPLEFIKSVFDVIRRTPQHQFQILTKRAERLAEIAAKLDWPDNVWMGVSVETADYVGRIEYLRNIDAKIRFLSLEPLLGPIPNINLKNIHWVIVGGESGPCARPLKTEWASIVRDQCIRAGVPFFFKQWGGATKGKGGRILDGRIWDQMPASSVNCGQFELI